MEKEKLESLLIDYIDGNLNETDKDRKSTRLNSSHSQISYAVFCLKKKTLRTPMASLKSANIYSRTLSPCCLTNLYMSPSRNARSYPLQRPLSDGSVRMSASVTPSV